VVLDPDEEVRATLARVFERFALLRNGRAVQRDFAEHGLKMPRLIQHGAEAGRIVWVRPTYQMIQQVLTSPVYAGVVRPELPDAHHTWGLAAEGPRRKECFTERRPHSPGCRYPAARRSNPTCRAPGTMG
jgi:hypothetical protein